MDRLDKLLTGIDRSMKILEIGPGYNPAVRKADGWNVWTIDHATRAELVRKYENDANITQDLSRMEEIDFIFSDRALHEAIPALHHGTFDAVIASHVIEHYPDIIGFFETAARVLRPDGLLSLAIPDKRYTFDAFKPLSTTGQALEAHHGRHLRHSRRTAFDNLAFNVGSSHGIAWGSGLPPSAFSSLATLAEAKAMFDSHNPSAEAPYVDFHCWIVCPASFELLVRELAFLGDIDFRLAHILPTTGCEFFCALRRGREAVNDPAAFQQQRIGLMLRTVVELAAQAEYAAPLVSGSADGMAAAVAPAAPAAPAVGELAARLALVESQQARFATYERRLRQLDRAITWPRRAARKVRKKVGRWLLADARTGQVGPRG